MEKQKKARVSYSIDPQILKEFNEFCTKHGYNRSKTLSNFMEEFVKGKGKDNG